MTTLRERLAAQDWQNGTSEKAQAFNDWIFEKAYQATSPENTTENYQHHYRAIRRLINAGFNSAEQLDLVTQEELCPPGENIPLQEKLLLLRLGESR